MYGLDNDMNTFSDYPYSPQKWEIDTVQKKYFRLLLKYDAYFIILCPGTNAQVEEIQRSTPFLDYPFIAGEQASMLARALKVQLSEEEFMPAILEVSQGTLAVNPIYIGRGPGNYFHQYLLKKLIDDRSKLETKGILCIRDINEMINQLKRKIKKCQNGELALATLSWSTKPLSSPNSTNSTDSSDGSSSTRTHTTMDASAITEMDATFSTGGNKQTKKQSLVDLPLEILEIIFSSYCDDINSLVKTSGTCRLFYIAICNVLILRLRNEMSYIKPALPQENGMVIWDEADVFDPSLDRWSENNGEGIPFCELNRRVSSATKLISNINQWTLRWSPHNRTRKTKRNIIY
ncbi:unnamed protein product [Mucor hiemalis]